MLLPPPNVTGTLHLGHALTVSVQDVLARWYRMHGYNVLWVPGTDHAGIATQVVVEKLLKQKNNCTRHDLGRDRFVEEVWKWKEKKGQRITEQLKMLGASLDWSRQFFTMDEKQSLAVAQAVVTLWEKGLLYKSDSLVNWSCNLRSAISDIEVDHLSISGPTQVNIPGYDKPVTFGQLINFAYKLHDVEEEIVVSTTRVETMLGDVAVAVHPNDLRYQAYVGKKLYNPLNGRYIPVIQDESVDPKFGTGAVKITPAHNHTDFEIAKKNNLPVIPIINEDGLLNSSCGKFSGLKRFEAREQILNALGSMGLLRGIQDHDMQLPICSRSGDVIELIVKPQWFVKCKEMAEIASAAVKSGSLTIEPYNFSQQWCAWLDNIRDWCISRQLWWGHRLPIYHCRGEEGSIYVGAADDIEAMKKAQNVLLGKIDIERETDVLDTWFSSALLPFTAFGWPKESTELKLCYPLSMMVTGHDIMFFWVARMVMLGSCLTGKLPFEKIMLHGIICDSQGRKMSKSLGNVIDPEDIINGSTIEKLKQKVDDSHKNGILSKRESELASASLEEQFPQGIPECGRDALRFTLLSYKIKSHYINFNVPDCYANRLFCNKIWQAWRFSCEWAKNLSPNIDTLSKPEPKNLMDKWILSKLSVAVNIINASIPNGDFHKSTTAIRDFLYSDLCDVYLVCPLIFPLNN
ncbi:hypothetical protein AAG570_012350 [Ranatra chinensis]|uniref:valine--tRNA ligase n=1 Tax=Ranatra chinensis TaxID=642074 RepID=A0ABD0Z0S7_9HEMI